MNSDEMRNELVLWKQKVQDQIKLLQEQAKACDALIRAIPAVRQPEIIN